MNLHSFVYGTRLFGFHAFLLNFARIEREVSKESEVDTRRSKLLCGWMF